MYVVGSMSLELITRDLRVIHFLDPNLVPRRTEVWSE